MSLKAKLDSLKGEVQAQRSQSKLEEGRQIIGDISSRQKHLGNKISTLRHMLHALESSSQEAAGGLHEFKESQKKISSLFEEYSDYLKERGINSATEIINNPEFADEEDIKDYRRKGAGLEKAGGKRGTLGEKIEKMSASKKALQDELPAKKLNFRRGKKSDENESPREASIRSINEYIRELEKELSEINAEDRKAKEEYLPEIKTLIEARLEKLFPAGQGYSIAPKMGNINLIDERVFELGGDELWPSTKEAALEVIAAKLTTIGAHMHRDEIGQSLEAEKLIFDVKKLRAEHEAELSLNRDEEKMRIFGAQAEEPFRRFGDHRAVFKDGLATAAVIWGGAQYFGNKVEKDKETCRASLEAIKQKITETIPKVTPGFLTMGEKNKEMKEVKRQLEAALEELNKLTIPDDLYADRYGLSNKVSGILPSFGSGMGQWLNPIRKELRESADAAIASMVGIYSDSQYSKLADNIYHAKSSVANHTINAHGFKLPAINLREQHAYLDAKDKKRFDNLIDSLNGQTLSNEEWEEKIKQEVSVFEQEIASFPGGPEAVQQLQELSKRYEDKFKYDFNLVDAKLKAQKGTYRAYDTARGKYDIKNELFYQ